MQLPLRRAEMLFYPGGVSESAKSKLHMHEPGFGTPKRSQAL